MSKYYNYIYLDPRRPGKYTYDGAPLSFLYEPFYVGKGSGRRKWEHLYNSKQKENSYKIHKIRCIINEGYDLKQYVIQINRNLTELESLAVETVLIKAIGRSDSKSGSLCNQSDGGEEQGNMAEEIRQYLSRKASEFHATRTKGKTYDEIYGTEKAEEIRQKQRGRTPSNKGTKTPVELVRRQRDARLDSMHRGSNHYLVYPFNIFTPSGESLTYNNGVTNFINEYNIPKKQAYNMLRNPDYSYKGWRLEKI